MVIEELFFTIIAFALFVCMFFKMISKNDTNYVPMLIIEAIGIAINFVTVILKSDIGAFLITIKYLFAILIPIAVIALEKRGIPFLQVTSVLMAKIYLKAGNNKKAKEKLINLVTKYPQNYIGHKMLAEIYEKEGGMRKAIDEYVQAIDIYKKDYDSYFRVAELLNNLDKSDEAAQMLFSLLNKKPDYYKATELLGKILIDNEMYKEAVNIYQNALRYNPTNYELNYNLGIAYTMLNDFQNAKVCYEKAAELNSLLYNAKYSLAQIALVYKEIEEAEKYFIQAIEDDELSADSYYELSKISLIKGEKDIAIKYANIAIDINSEGIVPKIKKDPIFIPVLARISMPFNLQNTVDSEKKHLQEKEIKAKEHLEDMSELTRNLGYDDIRLLKKESGAKNKKQQKENIKEEQKEIQE